MLGVVTVSSLVVCLSLGSFAQQRSAQSPASQQTTAPKQLAAVRGEVVKITTPTKGMLLITVKPAKEFSEITVLARENDMVGAAVGRSSDADLLGLLSDDSHDDETITAAELNQGDVISVIYDPQRQNRVLEIYLH